jgi:ribonucleotide reductase alpha subunit
MTVSANAMQVLKKRYLSKDENGNVIEEPEDLFKRVGKHIAKAEDESKRQKMEEIFTKMMSNGEFLPNSPTLMNAGTGIDQLAACFVLPIEDSMEGIFDALKNTALVQKMGGGTGFSFSRLRSKNSTVGKTGGISSGPVSFMKIFNIATEQVKQGFRRRGANIAILLVNHPDIVEFITCKREDGEFNNFNISVAVTDEFMQCVKENKDFPLIDPHTNKVTEVVNAKELFNKLVENAWVGGDPGIMFIDTVNKDNPTPLCGKIEGSNPCVVGGTLVAIADGRDYVPIKQLAEEGKDVPVYCADQDGEIQISMMRNPRKTGENKKIVRVTLDDESFIRVTEDHKFVMRDHSTKKASDLKHGDSLLPFNKFQYLDGKAKYWNLNLNTDRNCYREHRYIMKYILGRDLLPYPDEIVHHKNEQEDYNYWNNLELISSSEHTSLHQTGDNNVMRDKWWNNLNEEDKNTYRTNMSKATSGEKNGMFGRHHSEQTKELISKKATECFKSEELRKRMSETQKMVWKEHKENYDEGFHKRAQKKLEECQSKTDLHCFLDGNSVIVEKICEGCGCKFNISWSQREVCYHSKKCFQEHGNTGFSGGTHSEATKKILSEKSKRFALSEEGNRSKKRAAIVSAKNKALKCGNLLLQLKEPINENTWDSKKTLLKQNGVKMFVTKKIIQKYWTSWEEFIDECQSYNHKVVSVEFDGHEDVYNGTVDNHHTIAFITSDTTTETKANFNNVKRRTLSGVVTRQCGETPLLPNEACNLGSINLSKFIFDNQINYSKLKAVVWNSVRFLDNTITMSYYPLEDINKMVAANRKVGLGVMGFADLLFQLGIPYNSDEGIDTAKSLMSFIQMEGHKASEELAKERGAFPNFEGSIFPTPIRNATVTTIAPTGTLSIIANCSSGIEPLFALSFTRTVMDNDKLIEINPYFKQVAIENGFYSEELMEEVSKTGSIQKIDRIPDRIKKVFVTSHDISPEWHVKMQAAFQRYTDNAVSKTVNLPHDATVEDVRNVYDLAYQLGCKGVTVYRDGSKTGQVLSFRTTEKDSSAVSIKDRPDTLEGFTTRIMTGLGALYVTVSEHEGKPFEVFATIGKSGRSATAKTEAIGRLVSLALRSGVDVSKIIEQLKGIGGEHPVFQKDGLILSVPDAISRVLEERYGKGEKTKTYSIASEKCPECGAPINFEEGCKTCHSCGYSKCS